MADDVDFDQEVKFPRPLRILAGTVVLLSGLGLVVLGVIFLGTDRSQMPHPIGALALQVAVPLMGLAFGYVGFRLVAMKEGDRLLKGQVAVVGGGFMIALGILVISIAAMWTGLGDAIVGGLVVAMGGWLVRKGWSES